MVMGFEVSCLWHGNERDAVVYVVTLELEWQCPRSEAGHLSGRVKVAGPYFSAAAEVDIYAEDLRSLASGLERLSTGEAARAELSDWDGRTILQFTRGYGEFVVSAGWKVHDAGSPRMEWSDALFRPQDIYATAPTGLFAGFQGLRVSDTALEDLCIQLGAVLGEDDGPLAGS